MFAVTHHMCAIEKLFFIFSENKIVAIFFKRKEKKMILAKMFASFK